MESKDKETEILRKNELTIEISHRIKEIRESKNYTQEQLAEKSKVDRSYIGHIEQGKKCISIFTAKKIAEGLGLTLSDLLKDL